jgi:hypothetical protein
LDDAVSLHLSVYLLVAYSVGAVVEGYAAHQGYMFLPSTRLDINETVMIITGLTVDIITEMII